jgi:hypothetical protein
VRERNRGEIAVENPSEGKPKQLLAELSKKSETVSSKQESPISREAKKQSSSVVCCITLVHRLQSSHSVRLQTPPHSITEPIVTCCIAPTPVHELHQDAAGVAHTLAHAPLSLLFSYSSCSRPERADTQWASVRARRQWLLPV